MTTFDRIGKGNSLIALPNDYTVVDLETTGLSPSCDEIIECAALRVQGGQITAEFQSLIHPSFPVSGFITELTGITNEMLDGQPSIREAMQIVANLGGINANGVTRATDYLVVGNNEYCSSIRDGKSSKQKKAERYALEGTGIVILDERTFYDMIQSEE